MSDWAWSCLAPKYSLKSSIPPCFKVVDSDPNDLKSLLYGRRTGKTTYAVGKVCDDGIPGEVHPFVGVTATKARDTCFPILERFVKSHGLGVSFNRQKLRATTDRGVIIQCMGLATKPEVEKLRGERYPGVIFDECGAQNQDLLKVAVQEAAGPATLDFWGRGGFGIMCLGTPSYAPIGFWHEICGGNGEIAPKHGFTCHRGNVLQNPYIRDPAEALRRKLVQQGWTEETPEYIREWLGKFCLSTDGLCYGRAWNQIVEHRIYRPLQGLTIVSMDWAENAPCAWAVIRVVEHVEQVGNMLHTSLHVHVLETKEKVCDSLAEIAAITRQLMKAYSAGWLVGDSAEGIGIRQLNQQYGLPMSKAEKSGKKAERIFMMQGMLRCGTLRIYEDCESLIEQITTLPWNEDRDDHHEAYDDHTCDALHYGIELALQKMQVKPMEPVPGSPEDLERKRLAMRKRLLNVKVAPPKHSRR